MRPAAVARRARRFSPLVAGGRVQTRDAMRIPGLTLGRALSLGLAGVTLVAALLAGVLLDRWGESLLASSETLREAASRRAAAVVRRALGGAEASLESLRAQAKGGVFDADDPRDVERALFSEILANPDLAEVTLTRANETATEPDVVFAAAGRWQVSVLREAREPGTILTTHTHAAGSEFVRDERTRAPGELALRAGRCARLSGTVEDPTAHLTFLGTARHHRYSPSVLWTDLHYAEYDAGRSEQSRRVVVTAMKALEDSSGRFLGVVRVGLLASRLDDVARVRVDEVDPADPHRVFLADAQGRLVTRLQPDQPFADEGGDLRPASTRLADELRTALAHPALRDADEDHPRRSVRFELRGRAYLLSAFFLEGAQDWRVGVLVPEDHYTGGLRRTRRSLLIASAVILAGLAVTGFAALRSVNRGLGRMVASAARMRDFDFTPAPARSPFRDVSEVLEDLEQAKTALRALGRYVPIGLVRQLYRSRREPVLGGELRDATLLFTDIEEFTRIAERVAPDALARALGRYFEAMTTAVHASGGIVDKYIGDAVMALWNAPEPLAGHAALACGAALAGREATERLMASPEWERWPRFRTRFGLHRDEVMVGHFGAPERISYTALGDGVNLASRLEGLNRVYGTEILASEAVRDAALDAFAFRLVDVVAVKGRAHGVRVHELLGAKGTVSAATLDTARAYEQAFEAYRQRRFDEALERFSVLGDDPPSRVLAERCRGFRENPPEVAWDGTYVAREK